MKNLAYQDRTGGVWKEWQPRSSATRTLFMPTRWERFWSAYQDMRGLGYVVIGRADNRRIRRMAVRGW